ncbi:hypothetical protein FB45DRAFT_1031228 [Roridomyces roridus]|uniref:C2 domain-containing protein n=1 Tax=Roridomyces roridus TaxID=1738132 RepID=A0AAD7BK04_9AGAR|nr:hypothetical protein FB45DRAFT_1031228 [Roridomyces roridus]
MNTSPERRTVTDPVTHQSLPIHDHVAELPAVVQVDLDPSQMTGVVDTEARKNSWLDDDIRRTRIQTAVIAGLSAFSGALVSNLLGSRAVCSALGLVAAVCVLYFWDPPKPRMQLRDEVTTKRLPFGLALFFVLWPIVNPALFASIGDTLEDALQATLPTPIHGVRVTDIGQGSEALRIIGIRSLPGAATTTEENDFVNLEVALAYRGSPHSKGHNAHLLLQFWISGGLVIPVWVEVTGVLATARMRVQLMSDAPFFSALTLTLLGQPRVTFKCTPLAKSFLNVMDIPGLSGWLQKAIDTAVGALKRMLGKRDQMDTETLGVVVVVVKSAQGFKDGDAGKFWESQTNRRGDPFVTIGWGNMVYQFGLVGSPYWQEAAVLLVGPSEMNARELLRVQLRDLDWGSSSDLLGTVELHLHDLMGNPKTSNRMSPRTDRFTDMNGAKWPGHLEWECGYFSKTTIEHHLKDVDEFTRKVEHETERRLREADSVRHDEQDVARQKKADLKDRSEEAIAGQAPAYCTVILNHERVYTTRTRLRSNKPFFSTGTERFIKDWRTTSLIIAVRDSCMGEDPLIGAVDLSLPKLLSGRSQICDEFSLAGGIGYGRVKISLVFRSVLIDPTRLPRSLVGWDVATLDIQPHARERAKLPEDLKSCRLVLRTPNGKGKLHAHTDGSWRHKREKPVRLAVHRRSSECLVVEFKHHTRVGIRRPLAFCTLWLKDVVDREQTTLVLSVWQNENGALEHARANDRPPDESGPQRLGTLELTIRLLPGLSGYHKPLAAHEPSIADVMQVLDATAEEDENGLLHPLDPDSSSEDEVEESEVKHPRLMHRLSSKIAHLGHHDET